MNLKNPTIICSCRYYCLDLYVLLVDFHVEGFPSCSHQVCQGGYVVLNDIDFDGAEQKICHNCVDELRGGGKSDKLNKVGYSIVYGMYESEEDEEGVEGKALGGGGDEVSIITVVYPHGTVSVSSLGSFSSIGSSSKPSHPHILLSIVVHHIQEYFKNKRSSK